MKKTTGAHKDYYNTIAGFLEWKDSSRNSQSFYKITEYKNRKIISIDKISRLYLWEISNDYLSININDQYHVAYKGRYWINSYNSIAEALEAIDRRTK